MQSPFSICFNKQGNYQLPCDITNHQAVGVFRQDNQHIIANFIPNGMPFIVRDKTIIKDSDVSWKKLYPDLAVQLRSILSLETEQRINIARMLDEYGSDMLTAIAEFNETELMPMVITTLPKIDPRVPSNLNGYASALAGATEDRLTGFTNIASKYQISLENVRQGALSKLPKLEMMKLEQIAKNLHRELNSKFSSEINKYFNKANSKGNVWNNSERGINIAKSSRNFQPIRLSSHKEFLMIKNFARKATRAGVAGLIIDAGFRADTVYNKFQNGGNWQKSAVIETTAFATAGIGAIYVGMAGSSIAGAAIGIALAATPLGWAIIIGAGLAAGFGGAMVGDFMGRKVSEGLYSRSNSLLSL